MCVGVRGTVMSCRVGVFREPLRSAGLRCCIAFLCISPDKDTPRSSHGGQLLLSVAGAVQGELVG